MAASLDGSSLLRCALCLSHRAHVYELAASGGPLAYLGYVGYEQSGALRSPVVTVNDFAGALPFSTQSINTANRS